MFPKTERIHFIGIGGSGMCGIAELLLNLGYTVTGSDMADGETVQRLQRNGARVMIGHKGSQVGNADVVVISSAIKPDNPEVQYARKSGIPVIRRAEMLAELMRLKKGIAIAGTHGKTTTTSMVASVLQTGGLKPTTVVGGKFFNIGSNARLGTGAYLVCEADESDGTFMKLSPTISIVTNIDDDHLDHYGTFKNLKKTFVDFINKTPFYGKAILCTDDPHLRLLIPHVEKRITTYGIHNRADIMAVDIRSGDFGFSYTLQIAGKRIRKKEITIRMNGMHNVQNSLAAIAVGYELGIPFEKIQKGLAQFQGVQRRLELIGIENEITIIDDYAHHPTELKATINALRERQRRLLVIFQPHRYSRTKLLYKEFARCFTGADELFITDIYSAGEKPLRGVSSKLIVNKIKSPTKKHVHYVPSLNDMASYVVERAEPGDIIATLGAGSIQKLGPIIMEKINARYN